MFELKYIQLQSCKCFHSAMWLVGGWMTWQKNEFEWIVALFACICCSAIPRLFCSWELLPLVEMIEWHLLLGRRWLWTLLPVLHLCSICGDQKKPVGIRFPDGSTLWRPACLYSCLSPRRPSPLSHENLSPEFLRPLLSPRMGMCEWMIQMPVSFFRPCELSFQMHYTYVILFCALSVPEPGLLSKLGELTNQNSQFQRKAAYLNAIPGRCWNRRNL